MSLILAFSTMSFSVSAEEINPFQGMINLNEDSQWKGSVFGDNGGQGNITSTNFEVTENENGTVSLRSENNRGKIASGSEGIAYYYQEIPEGANFELTAKAHVDAWTANNQVSFGLMLRSNILENTNNGSFTGEYLAVGALDQMMKGFYKQDALVKDGFEFSNVVAPSAGQSYDLSIQKAGDLYVLKIGNETKVIENFNGDINYAGLYVSRNTTVTFSDINLNIDTRVLSELQVNTEDMKTEYLVGEALDLTGLEVTAIYDDGSQEILVNGDYIVTGFDSSVVGTNAISIHYNGVLTIVDLDIVPLTVTNLEIRYFPAKTNYYLLDTFNSRGLVVVAEYNNGYSYKELNTDQYTIYVEGVSIADASYVFDSAGNKTVTIRSNETIEQSIDFTVNVRSANIESLEIRKMPEMVQYFLGDTLDLDGMVVYAKYSDGSEVRLLNQDYEVSLFDSSSEGDKEVIISHKGETVILTVNVKERESEGLMVTSYPKTTFFTGEAFDSTGLVVSKVYDNGDVEVISDYTLNTDAFNNEAKGVYDILVVPTDSTLEGTAYKVTVREEVEYEWKQIVFGQSINNSRNSINVKEDGTIEVIALEGGGKVTGDHDGISFYYTEIDALDDNFELSADIKVVNYAKTPHDGQEAFGIMARDAIGTHLDSSVFASNIAAIGGFSGGTREAIGTQMFIRTGVLGPDGEGSQGIQKVMLNPERPTVNNTYPAEEYRLTLAKTNSGYEGQLNNGEEIIFFEPEILGTQDSKIYVGFFTARLATIEVSNIDFTVTAAATDEPKVEAPKVPVDPSFEIVSLDRVSLENYELKVQPNVNGIVTVKQGQEVIAENIEVEGSKVLSVAATLAKNANTNFSVTFVPDNTQLLTSYDVLVQNYTVTMRTYVEDGDIYVSPTGRSTGDGTIENPLDLDTAIDFVRPGQKIIVQDGHYVRNSKLEIKKYNDGTADAMKYLIAEEGTRPVIDFDQKSEGMVHSGHYWHVKGLDFARSAGNTKGYTLGGSHNIIELSRFYENGDTGLQISRTDPTEEDRTKWPSHNLLLNVTSFDNRDPAENNADGFAAKLTSGEGNIFRGAVAHNNIDDGWDLYTKVGTGAIGAVIIEDSIAYNNGFLTNGYVGAGDKNGFKLGGEGVHVPHIIRNSVAFGNLADGFSSNSNPGVIATNNLAFNNGTNLNFYTYTNITPDFTVNDFISYQSNNPNPHNRDRHPVGSEAVNNYFFNGTNSVNSVGDILTDSNFNNLDMPTIIERNADGSINWDFLRYTESAISFKDLAGYEWARKDIEVLASKGIIRGVSETEKLFNPSAKITRADFTILLVKTLGLTASVDENFKDIKTSDYFYNEVATAKALGIAYGVGNDAFNPRAEITREDMMTLTARAMEIAGLVLESGDESVLDQFVDKGMISSYALESMTQLVNSGLIVGYNNEVNPRGNATRAETASFMNRIYKLK